MLNRKYSLFILVLCLLGNVYANNNVAKADTTLFQTFAYNNTFYNTVLDAAVAIAQPFLVQEGYFSLPNVSTVDTSLVYGGVKYPVSDLYLNPATGYYISSSLYSYYGISAFSTIWPTQIPNAIKTANIMHFASKGFVATAYEFGTAFPTYQCAGGRDGNILPVPQWIRPSMPTTNRDLAQEQLMWLAEKVVLPNAKVGMYWLLPMPPLPLTDIL